MHEGTPDRVTPSPLITRARPAFFLLARPTGSADTLPASIGEPDVFYSEAQALDALDIHFAWCAARFDADVVDNAQWYLQSAMVGPRIATALGEVYLAADTDTGEVHAAAGAFLTEGEVVHWAPFVDAVAPRIPNSRISSTNILDGPSPKSGPGRLRLAYRGDAEVSFSQVWFAPMDSTRVYPKRIHIGDDAL
ncbi:MULTISPECIES: hypothetical protein [Gordonia]|uniref:hypothetical protein n=1 Tax=Gordonia TaxID=2053 RepID=UPI0007EB51D4|nr:MULTISPECIES: hypothetical protein [Gordonia]MCM3895092.1 hypothetical protein [Gordonia sputi]OBA65357.1 hypothetical protein A5777_20680 [Gordonia sp. 852002-10350_SCH5691597]